MKKQTASPRTGTPIFWLMAMVALTLIGLGSWIYWRHSRQPSVEIVAPAAPILALSETTMKILAGLERPVELKLFAPKDNKVLSAALGDYVGRVESLLAEYERGAAGKLRVVPCDPAGDATAKALAGAAGVIPFVNEAGEIIYLGLTVGSGSRIESIAPLTPEWEAALESDISRAIQRVSAKPAVSSPAPSIAQTEVQTAPIDPVVSEQLLRMFPNLKTRSYEAMAQELRLATLEEFKSAAAEMQAKMSAAQQELAEAQANKSEAAQQVALQKFQQVQAAQADKLKGITATLQDRLTVLQQLKSAR